MYARECVYYCVYGDNGWVYIFFLLATMFVLTADPKTKRTRERENKNHTCRVYVWMEWKRWVSHEVVPPMVCWLLIHVYVWMDVCVPVVHRLCVSLFVGLALCLSVCVRLWHLRSLRFVHVNHIYYVVCFVLSVCMCVVVCVCPWMGHVRLVSHHHVTMCISVNLVAIARNSSIDFCFALLYVVLFCVWLHACLFTSTKW